MSGIAGVIRFDGTQVPVDWLKRQADRLTRHGPGRWDQWRQDNAGAVCCGILAEPAAEAEHQLSTSSDGRLIIVADVRLDNRAELIDRLKLDSGPEVSISDSELILAAYRMWDAGCCDRLLGDFAFSIWDVGRQRLFCARDHFGVKPLYYYLGREMMIFGSEIGAILAIGRVQASLDEQKLADHLLGIFENRSRTFYREVARLPPAHCLTASRGDVCVQAYWTLDPGRELRFRRGEDYAEAYRVLFVEAVQARLRGRSAIGSMLSGGLDSSSITCVARHLLTARGSQDLHTFSTVFDSVPQSDERAYIQTVLASGSYVAHFVHGDRVNPISDLCSIVADEDEPVCSPQMHLSRGLWAAVQQVGVRVVLDGLMGDTVVSSGYFLLDQWAREGHWISLCQALRAMASNHPDPAPVLQVMVHYVWEQGLKTRFPAALRRQWRALHGHIGEDIPSAPSFLNPHFVGRTDLLERLAERQEKLKQIHTARQQHYQELADGLVQTALELFSQEIARFGLQARFPYLDRRLAEYCLAIPAELKLRDGHSRWVARAGMAGYLPASICWRSTKGDLSWNLIRGLRAERGLLTKILALDSPAADYLDMRVVRAMGERSGAGLGSEDEQITTFLIVELILWLAARGAPGATFEFLKGGESIDAAQNGPA